MIIDLIEELKQTRDNMEGILTPAELKGFNLCICVIVNIVNRTIEEMDEYYHGAHKDEN